jgi:dihydrofolate synthase / folylpolyglutamate synthase
LSLDELLPWLFGRTTGGVRLGLERTERLLGVLGDPHRAFRVVHIGGTNGKGSVAALSDAVLRARPGRRVGLYTSPHLIAFPERIRVDGTPIEEGALVDLAQRLRPEIERTGATFFEATTAIAFGWFAEAGVELAVVEVGLGGRLDATNVAKPGAIAITGIDREHMDLLGRSLTSIATEKVGILKAGSQAISAERRPEIQEVLRASAAAAGASLHFLEECGTLLDVTAGPNGIRLRFDSRFWGCLEVDVALAGRFQGRNAFLAAELLALLEAGERPTVEELRAGFGAVYWPGRLQLHRHVGTTWVLDVAHNPAGVSALCESLDELELPSPHVLVAGVLADKEWAEMLPPLLDRADVAILTTPASAPPVRRWDPHAVERELADRYPGLRVVEVLGEALDRALSLAPYGTIVVTGSIHTVGDAMTHLGLSALRREPGRQAVVGV